MKMKCHLQKVKKHMDVFNRLIYYCLDSLKLFYYPTSSYSIPLTMLPKNSLVISRLEIEVLHLLHEI